ncbi:hypothetical protein EUX98_g4519 [Antrodiella citrinella]|uniref:Ribosome maturation protein SDO1/SBDS N-terminal domain-containing protein n=1 Tax=Antrodiella citrinella TaxID=2447956 RepID=A0A4S4N1R3_9APHY|nr:hypothetical protein EUX98_g4519 [Antrodiella citrinella]
MAPPRKALSKVVYKPDTQSTDEYTVIVNLEEFKKWKEGDTSIPLTEVVDSFQVFFSNQGTQGILGQASNQQLDSTFGTHKDIDVVLQLLDKGTAQQSDSIASQSGSAATNLSKGSFSMDTRGARNGN